MGASKRASSYRHRSITSTRIFALAIALTGSLATGYLLLGSSGWVVPLAAQQPRQAAADVDSQTTKYPSGSTPIEAYSARPKSAGKHAAIIVVHDDQGLNDAIRGVTRLFAQAGFVALAPNLLSRSAGAPMPPQTGRGGSPAGRLPATQTIDDVKAAFAFLQQDAGVDAAKISAVGLGWGGYRVWRLAQQTPTLSKAVVFYAVTPTDDQIAKITPPVLAHYAQYDFLLTANALKTQKQMGKKFTYYVYAADRGFMGGGGGAGVDITALAGEVDLSVAPAAQPGAGAKPAEGAAGAAKQAFERTLAFLRN